MAKTKKVVSNLTTHQGTTIRHINVEELPNAIVIVGLPGIGLVSKLTVDNMVKTLKAKKIASVYSPHFPNQVISMPNGKLRPFGLHVYIAKTKGKNLIFIRGDMQPITIEGQYEVSVALLEFLKKLKATTVIAMAGYAINKKIDKPKTYVSSTNKELLAKIIKAGSGKSESAVPIVGMAGLLPGLSPMYSMAGTCILVETPGPVVDANGATVLTNLLCKHLGIKVDSSNLFAIAKKTSGMIEQFEKQGKTPEAVVGANNSVTELAKRDTLSYIR